MRKLRFILLAGLIFSIPECAQAAINFTNLGASSVTATNPDIRISTDLASYANSSWTPPTSGIIILAVHNYIANCGNVPTVSGNGLTWTNITSVCVDPGTAERITIFATDATGSSAGVTTADFAAQTQLGCRMLFSAATGVDVSGGIAAAFVQTPTNNGTATSGSVTLAAAGNSDARPYATFTHFANEATAPDAAWTELDDVNTSGPSAGSESQMDNDGFQNASASWTTSSAWLAIAAELKATAAGATTGLGWWGKVW